MIAIIPHKMFSLCKQSLKYNRRIMWNWKTSPPGIKKKFLKNTYCASAWHYLSKLYLTTPQNVKISCNNACLLFQFQFFSKTQIIFIYATCYTYIYIQINTKMTKKKNPDKNHKHMPIICRRHLLCNLIYRPLKEYKH